MIPLKTDEVEVGQTYLWSQYSGWDKHPIRVIEATKITSRRQTMRGFRWD